MIDKGLLTKRKILKQLYLENVLSCSQISTLIDKSIPLTTKLLNELIEKNIVKETGYAESTGGRRPVMYTLENGIAYIVAVSMDQFITRIVIMDLQNNYVSPVEKIELSLTKNKNSLTFLANSIEDVIDKSGIDKSKITGVGIGMPGFVDIKRGVNYSYLENDHKSISNFISGQLQLPVFIDNDSTLIGLAEFRFGAARHKKNALVINMGWGIGLGLILNGELYRGNNGFAGEFSHIPLFTNTNLCACGKSGCLESEASLLVIIEKARIGIKEGRVSSLDIIDKMDLETACGHLLTAAGNGDKFAIELLSAAGYNIGKGIAILIHLFNPESVILSGRGSSAGRLLQTPVQQALNEYCIPRLAFHTAIEMSKMGYYAELIGAAALVMENYDKQGKKELPVMQLQQPFVNN